MGLLEPSMSIEMSIKAGKPDLMPDIADQIRLAAKAGEKRMCPTSSSQDELHHLAWAGAGASILEAIRILTIIAICSFTKTGRSR
jgi:hypothetical protein